MMYTPLVLKQRELKTALAECHLADYFEFVCQELRQTNPQQLLVAFASERMLRIITTPDEVQELHQIHNIPPNQLSMIGIPADFVLQDSIISSEAVLALVREYKRVAAHASVLLELLKSKQLDI